jgi:hypothetical protein
MVLLCACGLFLFALRDTNKDFWCCCRGTVVVFSLNLVHPRILYLFFLYKKQNIFTMNPTPLKNRFASKGEFLEPPLSPKPNRSSGCGLRPSLIAVVRVQPFPGHDNEDP